MSDEINAGDYVIVRNGCQFSFPRPAEVGGIFDIDEAPMHIRFVFQGGALIEFLEAGTKLLREMLEEAREKDAEQAPILRE
jgi:hypothetical protein